MRSSTGVNLNDRDSIMKDYDVEFYMKRGLSQDEAIEILQDSNK